MHLVNALSKPYVLTVRIDRELRERMRKIRINWSEFVREAIRQRVELEERKAAGERLLKALEERRYEVPKGFINSVIREAREGR